MPVILVAFGYSRTAPESLGADRIIEEFAELHDALAGIWASRGRPALS